MGPGEEVGGQREWPRTRVSEGQPEETGEAQEFLAQPWQLGILSKKAKTPHYSALEKGGCNYTCRAAHLHHLYALMYFPVTAGSALQVTFGPFGARVVVPMSKGMSQSQANMGLIPAHTCDLGQLASSL